MALTSDLRFLLESFILEITIALSLDTGGHISHGGLMTSFGQGKVREAFPHMLTLKFLSLKILNMAGCVFEVSMPEPYHFCIAWFIQSRVDLIFPPCFLSVGS